MIIAWLSSSADFLSNNENSEGSERINEKISSEEENIKIWIS